MAKILSQQEIDALLSTVASAGGTQVALEENAAQSEIARKAVAYDFKHPNRVSKDQMRTLESLHSNFAGHLGSALSGFTRSVVDIDLLSVDQITYSEFIMSLASPSCTYVFSISPLEGAGIIDINPSVVFAFVDRMFGGTGKSLNSERELTGIEKSVMAKIIGRAFKELERAWEHIMPLHIAQTNFESNPQFIQIVPPGETVIIISLQIKMQSSSGIMTICYPYLTLEGIVDKLSAQNWIDKNKKLMTENEAKLNVGRILPVRAPIRVVLGSTTVTIRDLLNVKVGDVLRLDQAADDNVKLIVSDKVKFIGKPGLSGHQLAIKINNAIKTN